jgi:hypothetical protein
MRPTKKEIAETIADRDYWQSYGNLIDARLIGWTYRQHAQFAVPGSYNTLQMVSDHCRMIDVALTLDALPKSKSTYTPKRKKK